MSSALCIFKSIKWWLQWLQRTFSKRKFIAKVHAAGKLSCKKPDGFRLSLGSWLRGGSSKRSKQFWNYFYCCCCTQFTLKWFMCYFWNEFCTWLPALPEQAQHALHVPGLLQNKDDLLTCSSNSKVAQFGFLKVDSIRLFCSFLYGNHSVLPFAIIRLSRSPTIPLRTVEE